MEDKTYTWEVVVDLPKKEYHKRFEIKAKSSRLPKGLRDRIVALTAKKYDLKCVKCEDLIVLCEKGKRFGSVWMSMISM